MLVNRKVKGTVHSDPGAGSKSHAQGRGRLVRYIHCWHFQDRHSRGENVDREFSHQAILHLGGVLSLLDSTSFKL